MTTNKRVILNRVQEDPACKLLLSKCSPEERAELEAAVSVLAGRLEHLADSLFLIAQDPERADAIKRELLASKMGKVTEKLYE